MKLGFSSLPFVMSSQTVSRSQPKHLPSQQETPPNLTKPNISSFINKKKAQKLSLVQYGLFNQPIMKKKKKYRNDVVNHVFMVKHKRSAMLEPVVNSTYPAGPQEVPVFPMASSSCFMTNPNSSTYSYYDDETTPTSKSNKWKSKSLSVKFSNDDFHHIIEATEEDEDSSISSTQLVDSYVGVSPHMTHQEEEDEAPNTDHLHYSTTSQPPQEPFNPQTLGIKMFFPREE